MTAERLAELRREWLAAAGNPVRQAEIKAEADALAAPPARTAEQGCCGQQGIAASGDVFVNACQLCNLSPTYWRRRRTSRTGTAE